MFRTKSWQCSQCLSEFWSLSSQFFDKLVAIGVQRFVDWSIRGPNTMGNFENTSWIVLVKNCTKNYLKFAPILISRIRDTRISKVSSGIVAILNLFSEFFEIFANFDSQALNVLTRFLGEKNHVEYLVKNVSTKNWKVSLNFRQRTSTLDIYFENLSIFANLAKEWEANFFFADFC